MVLDSTENVLANDFSHVAVGFYYSFKNDPPVRSSVPVVDQRWTFL